MKILKLMFLITFCFLGLSPISYAGTLDLLSTKKNEDLLNSGFLKESDVYKNKELFEELSGNLSLYQDVTNGDHDAENRLGMMYYEGKGMAGDKKKAAYWFGRSARGGAVISQTMLGLCFKAGDCGLPIDYKKAFFWFQKAADQGDERAQTLLGLAYAEGQGVGVDYEEAAINLRMAADQGYSQAQSILGLWYLKGDHINKNYEEGIRLLKLSAAQGDEQARKVLKHYADTDNPGGAFAD